MAQLVARSVRGAEAVSSSLTALTNLHLWFHSQEVKASDCKSDIARSNRAGTSISQVMPDGSGTSFEYCVQSHDCGGRHLHLAPFAQ